MPHFHGQIQPVSEFYYLFDSKKLIRMYGMCTDVDYMKRELYIVGKCLRAHSWEYVTKLTFHPLKHVVKSSESLGDVVIIFMVVDF